MPKLTTLKFCNLLILFSKSWVNCTIWHKALKPKAFNNDWKWFNQELPSLPPPDLRHRAKSLPVPSGRTATGGCWGKFALSESKNKHRFDNIFNTILFSMQSFLILYKMNQIEESSPIIILRPILIHQCVCYLHALVMHLSCSISGKLNQIERGLPLNVWLHCTFGTYDRKQVSRFNRKNEMQFFWWRHHNIQYRNKSFDPTHLCLPRRLPELVPFAFIGSLSLLNFPVHEPIKMSLKHCNSTCICHFFWHKGHNTCPSYPL